MEKIVEFEEVNSYMHLGELIANNSEEDKEII